MLSKRSDRRKKVIQKGPVTMNAKQQTTAETQKIKREEGREGKGLSKETSAPYPEPVKGGPIHRHHPTARPKSRIHRFSLNDSAVVRHSSCLSFWPCKPYALARKYQTSGTSHPGPRDMYPSRPALKSTLSGSGSAPDSED